MNDAPGTYPNPSPRPNDHPPVLDAVIADLRGRARVGAATYGTPREKKTSFFDGAT